MSQDGIRDLLHRARAGDNGCRNELIERHRTFVARVASAICQRPLHWDNDDELSVALLAFNEAVDSFNPGFGRDFLQHARLVIRKRLIDHFRREGRHKHLSLDRMFDDAAADDRPPPKVEADPAMAAWQVQEEVQNRAAEIAAYAERLKAYNLTLEDLFGHCPSHQDRRERLTQAARELCARAELVDHLKRHRQLPLAQLEKVTGLSRKVLETGRRYIVALAVLMIESEFVYLRSFAGLPAAAEMAVKGGEPA